MTVDQCYSILRFIVRKNQLGSLSPSDFQYAFNTAQRNYYDLLVGRIEQYRYDKPNPRIGLSMTDNVVSRLMPFQRSTSSSLIGGLFSKPSDFNKLLAMYTANNYRVYRVEENRFAERIQDSIDPVNEANAFYVEESADFRVYPSTYVGVITIKYLFSPADVIWNYTTDGSGRPVYTSSGSVDPKWKDNDIDEILARAAKIIGVSLKEPILTQFGEQVIAKGE